MSSIPQMVNAFDPGIAQGIQRQDFANSAVMSEAARANEFAAGRALQEQSRREERAIALQREALEKRVSADLETATSRWKSQWWDEWERESALHGERLEEGSRLTTENEIAIEESGTQMAGVALLGETLRAARMLESGDGSPTLFGEIMGAFNTTVSTRRAWLEGLGESAVNAMELAAMDAKEVELTPETKYPLGMYEGKDEKEMRGVLRAQKVVGAAADAWVDANAQQLAQSTGGSQAAKTLLEMGLGALYTMASTGDSDVKSRARDVAIDAFKRLTEGEEMRDGSGRPVVDPEGIRKIVGSVVAFGMAQSHGQRADEKGERSARGEASDRNARAYARMDAMLNHVASAGVEGLVPGKAKALDKAEHARVARELVKAVIQMGAGSDAVESMLNSRGLDPELRVELRQLVMGFSGQLELERDMEGLGGVLGEGDVTVDVLRSGRESLQDRIHGLQRENADIGNKILTQWLQAGNSLRTSSEKVLQELRASAAQSLAR